ncbi:MAG TPA: DHA2 family efflux MFS transporter permease subunit [Xanthobacteraceae bacterium]|jgi:EmrB/QacA subfamily drug resistance transporter
MDALAQSPASLAALRAAICKGREPPAAARLARMQSYRWFVIATVCIGAFMGQVDSSIAQLLLPRLELEFDARLNTVSWVAVAYLLAMAAFLPVFGRLADIMGRKLLYTGGFLMFVLGSALCGFAPDLPVLIAFRVLQGVGAALLSANSVAIVVAAAGPQRRGRALGVLSAAQAVGLSAGPAIGGLVLDLLDWRWVFWINVPVGLAGTVMGWFVLPPTPGLPEDARFDWHGALLIAPALTALVAMLNEAYAWGAASPALFGCALLAAIALALFIRAERRAAAPLIDLSLFRRSAFSAGNVAGLLAYAALFGLFFLMPFTLVRVYRDTIFAAGMRLSIVPVMLGMVAPLAGALYDRLGARLLTGSGMLICVAASVLLYVGMDGAPGSLPLVMLALAIFGVGQGLFISPNNSAVVAAAPASLTGEAGGLINVMRSFGISVGVAAASSLLAWRLSVLTGSYNTLHVEAQDLISAGRAVLVLLGAFAAVAAAISLLRTSRPAGATKNPP